MSDTNAVPQGVSERQPFTVTRRPPRPEPEPTVEELMEAAKDSKEVSPFKVMRPNTDSIAHEGTPEERIIFTDFRPDVRPIDAPEPVAEVEPEPVPKDVSAQVPVQSSESPKISTPKIPATSVQSSVAEDAGKPSPPATS